MIPNITKNKPFLGPKMVPKMEPDGDPWAQRFLAGAILQALVFKMAPRWPREAQDSLLGAFLGLQRLSWKALDPQKH